MSVPTKAFSDPLIPLPIINIPFKQVGMDLIKPLPKSTQSHEYVLVLVEYIRHSKAAPLGKPP